MMKTPNGKVLVILDVYKGDETPYYYSEDGVPKAYVCVGNESVKVADLERLSVDMNFKLIIMRVKDHHSAQTDISLR